MKSILFRLDSSDFVKGLIMAALTGFAVPFLLAIQDPNFSFATLNWHAVITLALNGAASGFAAYLMKQFFSDQNGKVFGKI